MSDLSNPKHARPLLHGWSAFGGALLVAAGWAFAASSFVVGCDTADRTDPDAVAPAVVTPAPGPTTILPDADTDGATEGGSDAGLLPDGARAPTLRLMTYNVKHGERAGLEALADVINKNRPDLVGLQEVDVDAARSAGVDQAHRLGQLTGMTSLFRTAFNFGDGGSYGVALLSRYPVITSERVLLPSSGEQRVLATVDVALEKGKVLKVGITHFDLVAASRVQQAAEVKRVLSGVPRAILLGDLNASPDEATIVELGTFMQDAWIQAGQGAGHTVPVDAPTRRIDYIFLGAGIGRAVSAEVVDERLASDHRPVVAEVPLP